MLLPAIVLGSGLSAVLMRQMRSAMLDSLAADYVRTARAKGLSESRVVGVHALRNSLITVTTVIGLQLGALISGAVITEQIFGIAGFGRLTVDAVNQRDYALIQGVVIVAAVALCVRQLPRRRGLLAAQSAHPSIGGASMSIVEVEALGACPASLAAGAAGDASLTRRFLRRPLAVAGLVVALAFVARRHLRAVGRALQPERDGLRRRCSPSRRSITCSAPTSSAATSSPGSSGAPAPRSRRACFATLLAIVIGVPIGLVAGYYRGWADLVISRAHRRPARVPVPHPRRRARGDPRSVAAERHARDRNRRRPRTRPGRPGRDACAPGGGLRPRRGRERGFRRSRPRSAYRPEHDEHVARAGDGDDPRRDHRRGGALVSRPRSPAADSLVGRDARRRAVVPLRGAAARRSTRASRSSSARSRSTCWATACATCSIRGRGAELGHAAGRARPLCAVRDRPGHDARGRPDVVHARARRGARSRRRVGLRQERDVDGDSALARRLGGRQRARPSSRGSTCSLHPRRTCDGSAAARSPSSSRSR